MATTTDDRRPNQQTIEQDPNDADVAAANARKEDPANNARDWMLQTHAATLCTTSAKKGLEGFPFGSIVPFCLSPAGHPVVFIASIAAHTANLRADNRTSLFVHDLDAKGDPQKSWRITVMGRMCRLTVDDVKDGDCAEKVTQDDLDQIKARYEQRIPFAIEYSSTHDFSFWRMRDVERIRYIAGFGKICWLSAEEVLPKNAGLLGDDVDGAIAHMNADHEQNMREICAGFCGFTPDVVKMTHLTTDGFILKTDHESRSVFIPFEGDIDASQIRGAIIDALKRARG